jgi:predicted DNA-binding protein (MmcQ/YjbR family)
VTYEEFDRFCASLPATTYVEQWGGAHVWKVGGKVFAIGGWEDAPAFTFKVSKLAFEMMKTAPGLRPAPYLASRGLSWLQRIDDSSLSDEELRGYLRKSHELVTAGLTRAVRRGLGLDTVNRQGKAPVSRAKGRTGAGCSRGR